MFTAGSGPTTAIERADAETAKRDPTLDPAARRVLAYVLDRVLRAWSDEAILISNFLPLWLRTAAFRDLGHQWFWDGQEHVDPAKEANAQATRLQSNTTTLAYEFARQGRDWESELRQRAVSGAVSLRNTVGRPVSNQSATSGWDRTQEQRSRVIPE